MALLFFFAGECGFEPETPASGNIVIIFSTPGIDTEDDGYLSGSGTLVVEEGDLKSYDLAIKETEYGEVLEYWGKRWSFQMAGLWSVQSIFNNITSIDGEEQEFELDDIDDEIPLFGEDSTTWTATVTWNDDGTVKGVETVSGEEIVWKAAYEYYEDGKLKSERIYSMEYGGFTQAYYYARYDDPDFPNFQTEVWYYNTNGDGEIHDDYVYEEVPPNWPYDESGNVKYAYTPDADDGSRVGEYIIYINSDVWIEDEKIELTYDESGNLSRVDIYNAYWGEVDWEYSLELRLDIVVPENLNFGFIELFFNPWHDLIIPFDRVNGGD